MISIILVGIEPLASHNDAEDPTQADAEENNYPAGPGSGPGTGRFRSRPP
jgi:hypothetical protein